MNFENSPIENCFLRGTPITCYQPNTCMRVDADKDIKYYNKCLVQDKFGSNTEKEVNMTENESNSDTKCNLSSDCCNINKFFNINNNTNCCDVTGIECDIDDNIIELNL